jgi:predicted peptidase
MFPVVKHNFVRGFKQLVTLESTLIVAIALLVVQLNWPTVRSWWYSPSPGRQVPQETDLGNSWLIRYLLYLPKEYNPKNNAVWPLLVFLHGAGEKGDSFDELEILKRCGPPALIDQGAQFPFVVASPQCPQATTWNAATVASLVDYLVEQYRIDKENIILAGYSMGGFGACEAVTANPGKYAGLVTVAGASRLEFLRGVEEYAYWAFHGEQDDVVPLATTEEVVRHFQEKGWGQPRVTTYPNTGHGICDLPFKDAEVVEWIASPQARYKPNEPFETSVSEY